MVDDEDRSPERIAALTAPITDDDLVQSIELFKRIRARAREHYNGEFLDKLINAIDEVIDEIEAVLRGDPSCLLREDIQRKIRAQYWN